MDWAGSMKGQFAAKALVHCRMITASAQLLPLTGERIRVHGIQKATGDSA
jgi:hypothetical protein